MDELTRLFSKNIDKEQARTVAQSIARLVGSTVLTNDQIIIGQPYCPFRVSYHNKAFYCFFYLSDVSYCFSAKPRPKTPWAEDFYVSLKEPGGKGARVYAPELSELLRVPVFRQPVGSSDVLDVAFSAELVSLFRRIQFNRVRVVEFSPVEVHVIASLDSAEFCVTQASIFKELLTLANKDAYERNKDFLDQC